MPEKKLSLDQQIDEKLADFADQVEIADSGDAEMSEQDLELMKLEETVLALHRTAKNSQIPPREMKDRIRANLLQAWNERDSSSTPSLLDRLVEWIKNNPRTLVYAGSFAFVMAIAIMAFPMLNSSNLLGSAGDIANGENPASELSIVMVILLLLMTGLFIWFLAKTKK